MNPLSIGIVTVSDRASQGQYEDRGGPAIESWLGKALLTPWQAEKCIVPDDFATLVQTLERLSDVSQCSLILTTGGTGPAPRDITPEATIVVCRKLLPGFGEKMRAASWNKVPTAILSRQAAGIRGSSLIVNLPGNPKAIAECLEAVFPAIPDCLQLVANVLMETNPSVVTAPHYHPRHAAHPAEK